MNVLTIGSAMIDTITIIDSGRIERMSMLNADSSFLLLEEGRKTEAEEVSTHAGGGAVNAAVAMARLGMDVAVLAKLGADVRAEAILRRFEEEGISGVWVKPDPRSPTGASVLISSHDRNAAIFTFRGANTLLEAEDLHDEAFAAGVVYVANLSNELADCFPAIVERAKKHDALVAANPGPRQLSARGKAFLESLAAIDILILNQIEADLLVPALITRWGYCAKAGHRSPQRRIGAPKSMSEWTELPGGLNRSTQHFIVEGKIDYRPISQRFRDGTRAAEKITLWDKGTR